MMHHEAYIHLKFEKGVDSSFWDVSADERRSENAKQGAEGQSAGRKPSQAEQS
jgi:hypothetical protein